MLVSEILATVRPAYCDTWDQVFEYFRTTPHEWRRVEELMEEIKVRGLIEPGRLDFHESFPGDEDFLANEEEYYYLGNGTHRFAAAVQLGLEDFPVTREQEAPVTDRYSFTEVELWIKREFLSPDRDGEDPIEECLTSSTSFRVNERVWAEAGGWSSTPVGPGRSYSLSFITLPHEELEAFAQAFVERIGCCIKPPMIDYLSVGNVTHYEPDFWLPEKEA